MGLEKLTFDHIMLKQLVHIKRASVELRVALEKLPSTEKLESQSVIASSVMYASLVLSNIPRASVTRRTHANHEPIVSNSNWTEWSTIDHIRILSIGLELACNGGECGGIY